MAQAADFFWGKHQDTELRAMWLEGASIDAIKSYIGCWRNAVAKRARKLGLPPRAADTSSSAHSFVAPPPGTSLEWPESDIALLRQLLSWGLSASAIGERLRRSRNCIIGKAKRLKLTWPNGGDRIAALADAIEDGSLSILELTPDDLIAVRSLNPVQDNDRVAKPSRLGQVTFREALLNNYGRQCAITSCSLPCLLEAAHVVPFALSGDHRIENGIALRSDLHTLFDRGLIAIRNDDLTVVIAPALFGSEYAKFSGAPTSCGTVAVRPSSAALQWHRRKIFGASARCPVSNFSQVGEAR